MNQAQSHMTALRTASDQTNDAILIAGLTLAEDKFRRRGKDFSADLTVTLIAGLNSDEPFLYRNWARNQIERAERMQ